MVGCRPPPNPASLRHTQPICQSVKKERKAALLYSEMVIVTDVAAQSAGGAPGAAALSGTAAMDVAGTASGTGESELSIEGRGDCPA